MELDKALNEYDRSVTGRRELRPGRDALVKHDDSKDLVIGEFRIEVLRKGREIYVDVECFKSDDNRLQGKTWNRITASKFVNQLVARLTQTRAAGYTIDKGSFKNFFNELTNEAYAAKNQNKAMASKNPTRKNPQPKWDANFRIFRKSGTGNQLAFVKTAADGRIKWNKGEVEKKEAL